LGFDLYPTGILLANAVKPGIAAEGQAVSLVSYDEMDQLRGIQRLIKTDMNFALVAGF